MSTGRSRQGRWHQSPLPSILEAMQSDIDSGPAGRPALESTAPAGRAAVCSRTNAELQVARAATPAIAAPAGRAAPPTRCCATTTTPATSSFGDEAVAELASRATAGSTRADLQDAGRRAAARGSAVAVLPVPARSCRSKAAAAALGVPKATMADRAAAERSTGYVHRRHLTVRASATAAHGGRRLGAGLGPGAVQRGQARLGRRAGTRRTSIRLTNAVTADIRA